MERPEIKLGGPQRELEEPQRGLKPREPWHGMGRKGPLRTLRASRDKKGPSIDMGGPRRHPE